MDGQCDLCRNARAVPVGPTDRSIICPQCQRTVYLPPVTQTATGRNHVRSILAICLYLSAAGFFAYHFIGSGNRPMPDPVVAVAATNAPAPASVVIPANADQQAQDVLAAARLQAQTIIDAARLQAQAISNAEARAEEAAQKRQDQAVLTTARAAQSKRYQGAPYSRGLR